MSTPSLSLPSDAQSEAVVCPQCHRSNLTGGLRCAYCGTYLSSSLDFDLSAPKPMEAAPAATDASPAGRLVGGAGALGSLALLALKAKTFLSLLSMGKVLLTLGSMLLFIVADAQIFGWRLGAGIAVCILIHELGHVFVNWRNGIPQSAPMFLPFAGAVILVKRFPDNPQIESECGAGGPFAGGLAAVGCLVLAHFTHNPFYLSLANMGFFLNLLNLVPFGFLDGVRIGSVFSPKTWLIMLLIMVLWVLKVNTPALWLIILGTLLLRFVQKDDGRYLLAAPVVRARMAALYVLLAIGLSYGASLSFVQRSATAPIQQGQQARSNPAATASGNTTPSEAATAAPASAPNAGPNTEKWPVWPWVVLLGVVALSWWGALQLIGRAAGSAWNVAQTRTLFFVLSLCVGIYAGILFIPNTILASTASAPLIWVNVAASAGALLFGIVQTQRAGSMGARPQAALLRLQMLAWAAAVAFLVAYATSSIGLFLVLAIVVFGFLALSPAARNLSVSALAALIGDDNRAAQYREKAGQAAPADLARAIAARRIAAHLGNDRGDAALPLLSDTASEPRQDGELLQYQNFLVTAFAQTGRFGDALQVLEQMLQSAQPDARRSLVALRLAHYNLAILALRRGWWDETLAQTDWILSHCPKTGPLAATSLRLRALAEAGRFASNDTTASALDAACNQALAQSHDSAGRALVACARIEGLLAEGKTDVARDEAAKSLRLRPANAQVQYWNARAQGRESLQHFAMLYPGNFWSQQAQTDLDRRAA